MEDLLKEAKEQKGKIQEHKDSIQAVSQYQKNSLLRRQPKPIVWETDVNKIDIKKLRNGFAAVEGYTFSRLDKTNLAEFYSQDFNGKSVFLSGDTMQEINENLNKRTAEEIVSSGASRYLEIISLIEKGVKLIPPLYIESNSYIDGEFIRGEAEFIDGKHRESVAYALGWKEVPILIYERLDRYLFSPDKWEFEVRKIEEVDGSSTNRYTCFYAVSKDGKKEVAMPGRFRINKDNKEFLEFGVIHSHY